MPTFVATPNPASSLLAFAHTRKHTARLQHPVFLVAPLSSQRVLFGQDLFVQRSRRSQDHWITAHKNTYQVDLPTRSRMISFRVSPRSRWLSVCFYRWQRSLLEQGLRRSRLGKTTNAVACCSGGKVTLRHDLALAPYCGSSVCESRCEF